MPIFEIKPGQVWREQAGRHRRRLVTGFTPRGEVRFVAASGPRGRFGTTEDHEPQGEFREKCGFLRESVVKKGAAQ